MSDGLEFIIPEWPAVEHVRALVTTRTGGVSQGAYNSFNRAAHVEDDPLAVEQNRQLLMQALQLPSEPVWLNQVHGVTVINAADKNHPDADAAYTELKNTVCTVMTADCLPVLFCNRTGTRVAAAHAGWRGLEAGVLEATVEALGEAPENLHAWLGPAIGPAHFEVGDEVKLAFERHLPEAAEAFVATRPGHWLADIYLLARQRLHHQGIASVSGGGLCTYEDAQRFYSYRRDGKTGRMASLIWMSGD